MMLEGGTSISQPDPHSDILEADLVGKCRLNRLKLTIVESLRMITLGRIEIPTSPP